MKEAKDLIDENTITSKTDSSDQAHRDLSRTVDLSSKRPMEKGTRIKVKGVVANGTHGARGVPYNFQYYYGGTIMKRTTLDLVAKMEELKHVLMDTPEIRFFTVAVPLTLVHDSAKEFIAQQDDPLSSAPKQPPLVTIPSGPQTFHGMDLYGSTPWRDSIAYNVYGQPREGVAYDARYYRAYEAACEEIFRDKAGSSKRLVFTSDTVSSAEQVQMFRFGIPNGTDITETQLADQGAGLCMRFPTDANFWNKIRLNVVSDNTPVDSNTLFDHVRTQQRMDELRAQSQNVNLSPEEVIADLRSTKLATENSCQVIGTGSVKLSMAVQPQTTETDTVHLGADGVVSFSGLDVKMDHGDWSHPLDCIILDIFQLTFPDNGIFVNAQNIEVLKQSYEEYYRPSLGTIRDMAVSAAEIQDGFDHTSIVGYRSQHQDITRLPTCIRGDSNPRALFMENIGFRQNIPGFRAISADGQGRVTLPARTDYYGLRHPLDIGNILGGRVDFSDRVMRRCSLTPMQQLGSPLQWQLRTVQPLFFFGRIHREMVVPVPKHIVEDAIYYGEE